MSGAPQTCDILILNGLVVTMDDERRLLDRGAVAVRGNRIVGVEAGSDSKHWQAERTIDCSGGVVIPGLVDCHNHLFQSLARGLGEGLPLLGWLKELMWPLALTMTREEARIAASLGAVEAVGSGITCVVDNHYSPPDFESTMAVADAMDTVGLRGIVAKGMFGGPTEVTDRRGLPAELLQHSTEQELEITRECILSRPPTGRIGIWPAPVNLVNAEQELVRRSVELAREYRLRWHTHCSESKSDPALYQEVYGISPVEWLSSEGLLGDATLAHAIWLSDREIDLIGETATGISHNPVSNQYLASGIMRLGDLREAGAVVGLGTDGASAGHRQDPFELMKAAVLLQRVATLDPSVATAQLALELATREGARYAGVDAGVLAPGKLADIVVIGLDGPHLCPLHEVVPALVYSVRAPDVELTMIDGVIVYEAGRFLRVDAGEVMEEGQARSRELMDRVQTRGFRSS